MGVGLKDKVLGVLRRGGPQFCSWDKWNGEKGTWAAKFSDRWLNKVASRSGWVKCRASTTIRPQL